MVLHLLIPALLIFLNVDVINEASAFASPAGLV